MSAETATLATFAAAREQSRVVADSDERLIDAARRLLLGGEVSFKLSTRVGPRLMPRWKFVLYKFFCRDLPEPLRCAPAPAMQRATFDYWDEALAECDSRDDQLLVMPRNRAYRADTWDVPVECRPLDPTDSTRFRILQDVFGHIVRPDPLDEIEDRLTRVETRLAALEAKGKTCASGKPG